MKSSAAPRIPSSIILHTAAPPSSSLSRKLCELPIKSQVALTAFATATVGLLVAVLCLVSGELDNTVRTRQETADRLTRLVALRSADALQTRDLAAARQTLAALAADQDVIAITIVDQLGHEFARYRSPRTNHAAALATIAARHAGDAAADVRFGLTDRPLFALLGEPFLEIAQPIRAGSIDLGTIEAYYDIVPLAELIGERLLAAAGVLLAVGLMAWLLAHRLQRLIAAPVEGFARHIDDIARTRDYSLRTAPVGNNEIATLARGFNAMLDELEAGHRQLHLARDAAEDANRAKSLFLATVSHEIRNPMNGVIGMADLLAFTELNDEQQRILRHIRLSADSLMRVINDILDFSKLEAGRMDVEPVWCNPREIVEDVTAFFQFQAADKGLVIRCEIAPDLPTSVSADPIRLRQILANFLANAVKFSTHGEIRISLGHRGLVAPDGNPRALLHFSVCDNGIGIAPKVLPRLFTPFTQADSSYSRRFGGTGLGLAICQQLVDLMGGEIGVDSTPGHGATFWFSITAQTGSDNPPTLVDRHPLDTREGCDDLAGLRVLVADDDAVNQVLVTAQLAQFHCEVTTVSAGTEALALLERQAFDLILMDGLMPDLDGYETTRRIRTGETANPLRPRVAIIAITGNAADRDAALACGMDDFLAKPYSQGALRDALLRHRPTTRHAIPTPTDGRV